VKKELFARSKDEFGAAINALQNLIREFHGRLFPRAGNPPNRPLTSGCAGPFPCGVRYSQGPGPRKTWRRNSSPVKKTEARRSRAGAQFWIS
jgi:hypothetical protein